MERRVGAIERVPTPASASLGRPSPHFVGEGNGKRGFSEDLENVEFDTVGEARPGADEE